MKIKFLIILAFSYSLAFCQTPIIQVSDSGSAENIYQIFETLDTSKMTTGIFYDKVIPFVAIFKFDGVDSIGIASLDDWRGMYFEMNKGAVNKPRFPNISNTFQNAKELYAEQNTIPIMILNVKYNMLKDSALEKGLVYLQNGKLFDTPNINESPYDVKRVFSAISFMKNIKLTENKFIISDDFYFSNDTLPIDHFEIDFDDGRGFNIYQKNEEINISYDNPGEKNVKLKIIFTDNSVLSATFKTSTPSCYVPPYDLQFDISSIIQCPGWTNTNNKNDMNDAYGKAKVTIWYAPGNHVLTKPYFSKIHFCKVN